MIYLEGVLFMYRHKLAICAAMALCSSSLALASVETSLREVVVGAAKETEMKSIVSTTVESLPAPVSTITKEEIEKTKVNHYLDLFRKAPGVYVSHFGQGDIGNGLTMRGFNGGQHGKETAVYVDGVPINHGTFGYVDMAWLAPEMVERIEIIRGPFSVLHGNNALSGSINIITKTKQPKHELSLSGGSFDTKRATATLGDVKTSVTPFVFVESFDTNGFRNNSDYTRYNGFAKLSFDVSNYTASVSIQHADKDWGAPGYIPLSLIQSGVLSRESATSTSDGGDNKMTRLTFAIAPTRGEKGVTASLWAIEDNLNRYSTSWNSTAANPSVNGGQQSHTIYNSKNFGWNGYYVFDTPSSISLLLGSDGKHDTLKNANYNTTNRLHTKTNRDLDYTVFNYGVYGQAQYLIAKGLKATAGVRWDAFENDIDNNLIAANSGTGKTSVTSPKIGLSYTPADFVTFFTNFGEGFRYAEATQLSPNSATQPKNLDLKPYKIKSYDIGVNLAPTNDLYLALTYYKTDTEGELRLDAASQQYTNIGETSRKGYEFEAKYKINKEWGAFLNWSYVDAKVKNSLMSTINGVTADGDKITVQPADYGSLGFDYETKAFGGKINADLYYQYIGKFAIVDTGSIESGDNRRYNAKVSFDKGDWNVFGGATYIPTKDSSEIMTTSTVAGKTVAGIETKPEWDFSFGIKYRF